MAFLLLIAAVVLIVSAVRNTYKQLGTALGTDIPPFTVWAAALFAIAAIGFIPKLTTVSRGLLTLVLVVLVITNYQNILNGFSNMWTNPPSPANSGGSSTSSVPSTAAPSTSPPTTGNSSDPNSYQYIVPGL